MADEARKQFLRAYGLIFMEPIGTKKRVPEIRQRLCEKLGVDRNPFPVTTLDRVLAGNADISEDRVAVLADSIDIALSSSQLLSLAEERGVLASLNPWVLAKSSTRTLRCLEEEDGVTVDGGAKERFFKAWCKLKYPLETRDGANWKALLVRFAHAINLSEAQMKDVVFGKGKLQPVQVRKLLSLIDALQVGSAGLVKASSMGLLRDLDQNVFG